MSWFQSCDRDSHPDDGRRRVNSDCHSDDIGPDGNGNRDDIGPDGNRDRDDIGPDRNRDRDRDDVGPDRDRDCDNAVGRRGVNGDRDRDDIGPDGDRDRDNAVGRRGVNGDRDRDDIGPDSDRNRDGDGRDRGRWRHSNDAHHRTGDVGAERGRGRRTTGCGTRRVKRTDLAAQRRHGPR